MTDTLTPNLTGIPETMLWTLHNRASEAMRPDAWLKDDHAVRIYRAIAYDYPRSFGAPDGSHAIRSLAFDEAVQAWTAKHPNGAVIELACGLETQFQRIDNGQIQWYCVDLPEAIDVRERFLPPTLRCRHLRKSALDLTWMDDIETEGPVFVSMQGLLMYFEESDVKTLLAALLARFPGSTLMFDVIPRWFSKKTLKGFQKTPHYQTPPMPWGINRDEIEPQFRAWGLPLASYDEEPYRKFRKFPWGLAPWLAKLPWLGARLPAIVRLEGKTDPADSPKEAEKMIKRKTAIVAAFAVMATSVMAQDKDAASDAVMVLEEITITANKVEEKLKDVPQSVTVITGEAIQEQGIRNVADLVREIPNLSSSFVYSNDINIRGINSSTFTNTNPVVIYFDGVPQSNRYSYDAFLENVDRVEVLRGPQGTLYGKDSIGGVINIITKTPTNIWSGSAGAEVANQDGREATFSLNGPVIKDRLFFTMSGKVAKNDGWITNTYPGMGPNANGRDDQIFRLGLHFKATPDTTLRLNVSRDDLTNDWIDGGLAPAGVALDDYSRDRASQARFDEATQTQTVSDAQSLSVQHKLGGITIDGIVTNKSVKIDGDYDADWGDDPIWSGLTTFQHSKVDTQTQELRLSGGHPGSLRWLGGLYHETEEVRNIRYGGQFPGVLLGSPFDLDSDVPSTTKSDTLAGFGQVMMPLSERFELTLGGRYQRIDKDFTGDVFFTPVGSTGFPPQFTLTGSQTWYTFLPKVALSYELTPNWTTYVSAAKGYLPGGFNYYPSSPVVADNRFEPQTSTNYEAGIRSDFGRLYLSAALFYMDIKDIHVYSYDANGLVFVTSNAGKGTSTGTELEASYLLTDEWEVSTALGLTDATYDEYPDPSINGNKIEKTPSYTARIGLKYTAGNGFYGRADLRGRGKRYFNPENTLVDDAYATLDLKAGYEKGPWNVYAYVRNLTDEDYVSFAQVYQFGRNMVTFGEPRRFGVGLRYSF